MRFEEWVKNGVFRFTRGAQSYCISLTRFLILNMGLCTMVPRGLGAVLTQIPARNLTLTLGSTKQSTLENPRLGTNGSFDLGLASPCHTSPT